MAGHSGYHGGSMYYCIDENLEQIKGTGGNHNGYDLYIVYAHGPYIPTTGYALTCVVCTK